MADEQEDGARRTRRGTPRSLMEHHAARKMALLARDPVAARRLGQIAADARAETMAAALMEYSALEDITMAKRPDVGGHANALQHLLGHVKDRVRAREVATKIEGFRAGALSLEDVKRALKAVLAAEGATWAASQTYLDEE